MQYVKGRNFPNRVEKSRHFERARDAYDRNQRDWNWALIVAIVGAIVSILIGINW